MKTGISIILMIFFLFTSVACLAQKKWIAPPSSTDITNPQMDNPRATATGKKLFNAYCTVCHGPKGKGDGMAGTGLSPKPKNLTSPEVQSQKDGAIFWKISEGRSPMPSYGNSLSEDQRWGLVNYIRTLGK